MKLSSTPIVLALGYLLLPIMAAAYPVTGDIQRQDNKTITMGNPEGPALKNNGPLPNDEEQYSGMALNATSFPDSVKDAMSDILGADARQATQSEIDEHIFYTKLSAASYCRTVIPFGMWNCKHCDQSLKMVKTFTTLRDDTNAMILRGDQQKTIYIVFRGTNSLRNFIVDANFGLTNYPLSQGSKVHTGFLASYNAVRDSLIKTLDAEVSKYPDYKVAITGHSLGGAQAVLHGLDLLNYNGTRYNAGNVVLFSQGQPRVGDLKFAEYELSTNIPIKRLVNKRDLVPHLPPTPPYFNAGEEYWITDNNTDTVKICPNGLESSDCADSIAPFTTVLDHFTYFGINMGFCL